MIKLKSQCCNAYPTIADNEKGDGIIMICSKCGKNFITKIDQSDAKMTDEKIDLKKEINELPNMEDHSLDYFLRMLATVAVSVGYDKGHPENEEISKWQDRVKKKVEQLLKQQEDFLNLWNQLPFEVEFEGRTLNRKIIGANIIVYTFYNYKDKQDYVIKSFTGFGGDLTEAVKEALKWIEEIKI